MAEYNQPTELKTIREMQQDLNEGKLQATSSNPPATNNQATTRAQLQQQVQNQVQEIEQILQSGDTQPQANVPQVKTIKESMQDAQNIIETHNLDNWTDDSPNNNVITTTETKHTPANQTQPPKFPTNAQPNATQTSPTNTNKLNPQPPTQSQSINQPPRNTPAPNANRNNEKIVQNATASTTNPVQTLQTNVQRANLDPVNITAKENLESNPDSDINELKQEKYEQIVKANPVGKQETWLLLEEFLHLSGLERDKVEELIKNNSIKSKQENGRIYIEASTGTSALIKKVENRLVSLDMSGNALDPVFVEKTIATILGLHDKVISSKDETISAFKSENSFLKEALVSMQEIYDDDKKTIEILRQQLQKTQEEVEFVKRKYKLMWGRVSNSAT